MEINLIEVISGKPIFIYDDEAKNFEIYIDGEKQVT